jgi:hypothetical protein
MNPHPTSLRVIFADSASNQERSPYPPPSRPSPSSRNRFRQVRARGGGHRSKNDWMFDAKELCQPRTDHHCPSQLAVNLAPFLRHNVVDSLLLSTLSLLASAPRFAENEPAAFDRHAMPNRKAISLDHAYLE